MFVCINIFQRLRLLLENHMVIYHCIISTNKYTQVIIKILIKRIHDDMNLFLSKI